MELIARNTKQLGQVLQRLRQQQKLTQTALGEKTQLRQATISTLENGEDGSKLQTVFDILTALDLELVVRPRSKGDYKTLLEEILS